MHAAQPAGAQPACTRWQENPVASAAAPPGLTASGIPSPPCCRALHVAAAKETEPEEATLVEVGCCMLGMVGVGVGGRPVWAGWAPQAGRVCVLRPASNWVCPAAPPVCRSMAASLLALWWAERLRVEALEAARGGPCSGLAAAACPSPQACQPGWCSGGLPPRRQPISFPIAPYVFKQVLHHAL